MSTEIALILVFLGVGMLCSGAVEAAQQKRKPKEKQMRH